MTGMEDKPFKFRLFDTRGLDSKFKISEEILSILEGRMPNKYEFKETPLSTESSEYIQSPEQKNKVHCVVFVVDIQHIPEIDAESKEDLLKTREKIEKKGIRVLILLNKVDSVCQITKRNLRDVYRSATIKQKCRDAAAIFGLEITRVLPNQNVTETQIIPEDIAVLSLYNLRIMLRKADENQREIRDLLA